MLFKFWCLEQKRAFKVFSKTIKYFLSGIVLLMAGVLICSHIFGKQMALKQIDTAVVIPEDGEELKLLTNFASSMQSVKSICHFSYMSEDEILERIKEGRIQAALVFPEHFYRDVDMGRKTSVKLYLPEEMTTELTAFSELLEDGISMLWTAEAGVFSVLKQAGVEKTVVPQGSIGNEMAEQYVKQMFCRSDLFESEVCSPFGIYGQSAYYCSTGMLFFLLAAGLTFFPLYRKRERAVVNKLTLYGITGRTFMWVRIVVMTNILMLTACLYYGAGCILTYALDMDLLFWDKWILPGLYLLCLVFAAFYHVIYAVTGDSFTGILVLMAVELIIAAGSGIFIPLSYLPEWMSQAGKWLPLQQWNMYNMNLLFGTCSLKNIMEMIGWLAVAATIGTVICKRD